MAPEDKVEILQHNSKINLVYNEEAEKVEVFVVYCRIKNKTDVLLFHVEVTVTFFDKEGNIVDVGAARVLNVGAGSERTLSVTGEQYVQNPASYEVQVTTADDEEEED